MKQYLRSQYWKGQRLLLLVFLLVHVVVSSVYITWQNITFDEKDYYGYSVKWLHGDVERDKKIYDSKTPVVAIAAVPRIIRQLLDPGYNASDDGKADIRAGRYMMVLFTVITALYLFAWIRRLFGEKAWIFPLLFFLFDPLVLGFSMIITSDIASGMCLLAAAFHLYLLYEKKNLRQLIFFSLWLGIGFVCKASLLYFIPYALLLFLVLLITKNLRLQFKKAIVYTLVSASVILSVMNLAYFGKDSFRPLERSAFQSNLFRSLSGTPVLKEIPVPLPYAYVQGIDMLQYHGEIGAGHAESTHHGTFLGKRSKEKGGFWYYYFYVGLFKVPVATMLLMIAGFFIALLAHRKVFFQKHAWYLLPFVFFLAVLSYFNPFQAGFRHFLLVYPFCFIFIAAAIQFFESRSRYAKAVTAGLFVYLCITVVFFFPWLIAYTNEFITDKKTVYRKISDSSIDYGQNIYQLERFKKKHPDHQMPPHESRAGKFIVPAFHLADRKHRANASWLTDFEPVAHYQYSMFIFHISESDITTLKQKSRH